MPKGKPANVEKYIKARAAGKSKVDAYTEACPDSIQDNDGKCCSAWKIEEKYKKKLEDLRRKADAGAVMDLKQAIAALAEIAADENTRPETKVNALDKIIKAAGGYTDRHEISMAGSLSIDDKRAAARAWIDKVTGEAAETP